MIRFLLFIALALVLFLVGINAYLHSNQSKIFNDLPFLNNGSVSFKKADIRVFKDFPSATITLSDFVLHDSLFSVHQTPLLDLEKITATASLIDILEGLIELQTIRLEDGSVSIFSDSTGYNNLASLFPEKKIKPENGFKLKSNQLKLFWSNIDFQFSDAIKTTFINGQIKDLTSELYLNEKDILADIDMSLILSEMTFKKGQGSFSNGGYLKGNFQAKFNDGIITINPFDLTINEEHFLFNGIIDTKKETLSTLTFENKQTKLSNTIPLLSEPIQQQLAPYQIALPFYSKTTLTSHFKEGEVPIVKVEFKFEDNKIKAGNYQFYQVNTKGFFKNRLYEDDKKWEENKKNLKIEFSDLTAVYDEFNIQSKKIDITSTPKHGPQFNSTIKINGKPSGISRWFQNDQFFFKKGRFNLLATLHGPLNDYQQIILNSEAKLDLNNFSVIYRPANSDFPFERLSLIKKSGDAEFKIISDAIENGQDFLLDGGLKNLPALLFKIANQTSSDATFVSSKISWTGFLDLFGKNGRLKRDDPKTDAQKKRSMKETIMGIQHNFQPRLSVMVDTLQYFDLLELHDFNSGVHFENENTIVLEKTSFKYEEGDVIFQTKMDISDPKRTPFDFELHTQKLNLAKLLPPFDHFNIKLISDIENLPKNVSVDINHQGIMDDQKGLIPGTSTGEIVFKIDEGETLLGKIIYSPNINDQKKTIGQSKSLKTKMSIEGKPIVFNEFFKTDQFFFDKGRFFAQFDYEGNVANFEELLNTGNANFKLTNSEVYYKLADVTFPLTEIELDLHQDHADFNIFLHSDSLAQEINFSGNVHNLSEVILNNTGKDIKTNVTVTSPKVKWQQFLDIFSPMNSGEKKSVDALKATVKGMLRTFDPNIQIYLDTFIYSDKIMLRELETGIQLIDTAKVLLNKTGFKFHDGSISVNGIFDLGVKDAAPFSANFTSDELDVAKLIESLDYLHLPSIKNLKELSGQATMNLDLEGIIADDAKGLISEANNGILHFELKNIILKGFEPLDEIAAKLRMKKRFEEIRFAPISNRLEIKGSYIIIPQMEIQSNAINMFVEGTLSYADNTNIWVSIPIDNLKKADRSVIPKKRGYAATRRKVYIEVTTDKNGDNRFKFRNTKRKFYKQRGILKQYKLDKKRDKEIRKLGN
ncbi:MAG: AsmA-like C-terminal region-containing protein [Saprospiraceae bacterium]